MSELREKATAVLREHWAELRDGAALKDRMFVSGMIEGLRAAGVIEDDEAELWRFRIETCPGHDDEGGRSWCAYGCKLEATDVDAG